MLLFSFLKDIIYRKEGNLLDNPDNEREFQPYLMQRWLSMYSDNTAKLLNCTVNRLYPVFETKQEWYKILLTTIPMSYFKKIKYIKKTKKDKKVIDNDILIEYIAKGNDMSKREVKLYIEEFDIDLTKLKKALDIKDDV